MEVLQKVVYITFNYEYKFEGPICHEISHKNQKNNMKIFESVVHMAASEIFDLTTAFNQYHFTMIPETPTAEYHNRVIIFENLVTQTLHHRRIVTGEKKGVVFTTSKRLHKSPRRIKKVVALPLPTIKELPVEIELCKQIDSNVLPLSRTIVRKNDTLHNLKPLDASPRMPRRISSKDMLMTISKSGNQSTILSIPENAVWINHYPGRRSPSAA
jgi:hypothetical protein